jgi:hypothetical protein
MFKFDKKNLKMLESVFLLKPKLETLILICLTKKNAKAFNILLLRGACKGKRVKEK